MNNSEHIDIQNLKNLLHKTTKHMKQRFNIDEQTGQSIRQNKKKKQTGRNEP